MKNSRHPAAVIARITAGTALAAGLLAMPHTALAQPSSSPASSSSGCLPLLCDSADGSGLDLDILGGDILGDLLGGGSEPPPEEPAPTTPTNGDIVDVDVDLGLGVDLGGVTDINARVPVDASIGTQSGQGVVVDVRTSPTVGSGSDGNGTPLADAAVSGVDVGLQAAVPGDGSGPLDGTLTDVDLACLADLGVIDTSAIGCNGEAGLLASLGLVDVGAVVDICDISVVVLGEAEEASCAALDDDDPTDGDDTADDGDDTTDSGVSDAGGTSGGSSDGPQGARRGDAGVGGGSELPLTGSATMPLLAAAAATTLAGVGSLLIRRRRLTA